MENRTILIAAAVFIFSTAAAFSAGTLVFGENTESKYSEMLNAEVNSSQNTRIVEFDNRTLQLMYEDSTQARMYIDTDVDGSFDIELKNLTHDGKEHGINQAITYNRTTYSLYFRYKDNRSLDNEGYLVLKQINQI